MGYSTQSGTQALFVCDLDTEPSARHGGQKNWLLKHTVISVKYSLKESFCTRGRVNIVTDKQHHYIPAEKNKIFKRLSSPERCWFESCHICLLLSTQNKTWLHRVMKNRKTMNYPCLIVWTQVNPKSFEPHWAAQAEYMGFTAVYPLPKRKRGTY